MNDNIVPIKPPPDTKSGLTKCLSCKHEWIAVSNIGDVWLDCPACGANSGHAKGTVQREGMHWQCKCGCQLFYINTVGPYCIECGTYADIK